MPRQLRTEKNALLTAYPLEETLLSVSHLIYRSEVHDYVQSLNLTQQDILKTFTKSTNQDIELSYW